MKNEEKKLKMYKGGYLPDEKIILDKKIHNLLDNPPDFKNAPNALIKKWLKTIVDLYKS